MSIGVALPTRAIREPAAVRDLLELAELLDRESGWSDLWVGDSILALPFLESMTLLAAVAARTERIGVGIACQATLGLRDPLLAIAQWAGIDQLSAGRATLVACPGWGSGDAVRRELRAYGIGYPEKTRRMERHIALLREASATGQVTLDGEQFELPTPFVQQPLPIWFTANPAEDAPEETTERLLARVARLGDGWLTYAVGPEVRARRVGRIRELRFQLGDAAPRGDRGGFPVCVGVNVNVNPDERAAWADARSAWSRIGSRNVAVENLDRLSAIGTPEHAAERLAELTAAGATAFSFYLLSDRPREQAELITEHLLPLLPAATTAEAR